MKHKTFKDLLQSAIGGNIDAINEILHLYEPLINHYSMIDGDFDEDCRQYIMLHLVTRIPKFKI